MWNDSSASCRAACALLLFCSVATLDLVHPGSPDLILPHFSLFSEYQYSSFYPLSQIPKLQNYPYFPHMCSHFFCPIAFLTFMGWVAVQRGKELFHPLSCPFALKAQQKPVAQRKCSCLTHCERAACLSPLGLMAMASTSPGAGAASFHSTLEF